MPGLVLELSEFTAKHAKVAKIMLFRLRVLCDAVFHKNYILTAMAAAGSTHCTPRSNPRSAHVHPHPGRIESAGHPESLLIQLRLAITTSAIPSSAHATPNPGDPWEWGWSVDEGSAAVRVGDMNAGSCAGIKRIHRKAREGRKDNVVSASRSLRCSIP